MRYRSEHLRNVISFPIHLYPSHLKRTGLTDVNLGTKGVSFRPSFHVCAASAQLTEMTSRIIPKLC